MGARHRIGEAALRGVWDVSTTKPQVAPAAAR